MFMVFETEEEALAMVAKIREAGKESGRITHEQLMRLYGTEEALACIEHPFSESCKFEIDNDSPEVVQFDDDYYALVFNDLTKEGIF